MKTKIILAALLALVIAPDYMGKGEVRPLAVPGIIVRDDKPVKRQQALQSYIDCLELSRGFDWAEFGCALK